MFLLLFILILIALILVHEFGHFSVAKLFGVKVDEFGVGFPPRVAARKFGETVYSFNWILVGGFVKIFGEDANEGAQNPRSFAHKNRGIQAAVLLAGVTFNIIFAWLILSVGYLAGLPTAAGQESFGRVENAYIEISSVLADSPAQKAGLKAGDRVEVVQTGSATLPVGSTAEELRAFIAAHQNESMVLNVVRGAAAVNVVAKPEAGLVEGKKALGVNLADVGTLKLPAYTAFLQGAVSTKDMTVNIASGLGGFFKQIFSGTADYSGVAGPIGIAGIGASAVEEGFASAILITALISINLAIINLLPIPGLDGGRLVIVAVEAVIRRPVNPRIVMALSLVGFALLALLMITISVHDISRLVG